jgi:hypothetical protein
MKSIFNHSEFGLAVSFCETISCVYPIASVGAMKRFSGKSLRHYLCSEFLLLFIIGKKDYWMLRKIKKKPGS